MKGRSAVSAAFVAAALTWGTAWGDASLVPPAAAPSAIGGTAESMRSAQAADAAFGLLSQDHWLAATQFQPRTGDTLTYEQFLYWSSSGAGTRQYEAQVNLPAGALVNTLECFFYDTSASNASIGFWKHQYDYSTDTPSVANITTVASAGTAGYQKPFQSISETIRYREGDLRNIYTLLLNLPGGDANTSFRGCRFFWQRQLAPAPASATFTDVPTSHPFFQVVEALRQSGVTSGCTATEYCPDSPVLRSQMAAFLARMGGLHWPY